MNKKKLDLKFLEYCNSTQYSKPSLVDPDNSTWVVICDGHYPDMAQAMCFPLNEDDTNAIAEHIEHVFGRLSETFRKHVRYQISHLDGHCVRFHDEDNDKVCRVGIVREEKISKAFGRDFDQYFKFKSRLLETPGLPKDYIWKMLSGSIESPFVTPCLDMKNIFNMLYDEISDFLIITEEQ